MIIIILDLESITYLETVEFGMSHKEVLKKYWGANAFSSEVEDDEENEENSNTIRYDVFNNDIDSDFQLGTITEILDTDNLTLLALKVYREVM